MSYLNLYPDSKRKILRRLTYLTLFYFRMRRPSSCRSREIVENEVATKTSLSSCHSGSKVKTTLLALPPSAGGEIREHVEDSYHVRERGYWGGWRRPLKSPSNYTQRSGRGKTSQEDVKGVRSDFSMAPLNPLCSLSAVQGSERQSDSQNPSSSGRAFTVKSLAT